MEAHLVALLQDGSSVTEKKFRHNAEFPKRPFPLSKVKGGLEPKAKKSQSLSLHQKKTFVESLLEKKDLDTSVSF